MARSIRNLLHTAPKGNLPVKTASEGFTPSKSLAVALSALKRDLNPKTAQAFFRRFLKETNGKVAVSNQAVTIRNLVAKAGINEKTALPLIADAYVMTLRKDRKGQAAKIHQIEQLRKFALPQKQAGISLLGKVTLGALALGAMAVTAYYMPSLLRKDAPVKPPVQDDVCGLKEDTCPRRSQPTKVGTACAGTSPEQFAHLSLEKTIEILNRSPYETGTSTSRPAHQQAAGSDEKIGNEGSFYTQTAILALATLVPLVALLKPRSQGSLDQLVQDGLTSPEKETSPKRKHNQHKDSYSQMTLQELTNEQRRLRMEKTQAHGAKALEQVDRQLKDVQREITRQHQAK